MEPYEDFLIHESIFRLYFRFRDGLEISCQEISNTSSEFVVSCIVLAFAGEKKRRMSETTLQKM